MDVSSWVIFFGRLHPLVVHLPIGFLLMALVFKVVSRYNTKLQLNAAISITLLLGASSAALASVFGYLLSLEGGYEQKLLDRHIWSGIGTTMLAGMAYAQSIGKKRVPYVNKKNMSMLMLVAVAIGTTITGHFGGSLTHGEDYLTMPFETDVAAVELIPPPSALENVQVYGHMVKPILDKKCKTCHRRGKLKGDLSFETFETFTKGGENGAVFVPGNSSKSEIVRRTHLDADDDDFMPSEGKKPLTAEEKEIIVWWIDQAQASFDTLFINVPYDARMEDVAQSVLSAHPSGQVSRLPAVDSLVLAELELHGFVIRELVSGSNMLDITLPSSKARVVPLDTLMYDLDKIAINIVWLNLSGLGLRDRHLSIVGRCKNLEKLRIEKNPITDAGIVALKDLEKLTSLNVYNTGVTNEIFTVLKDLKKLRSVYTFNTKVTRTQ